MLPIEAGSNGGEPAPVAIAFADVVNFSGMMAEDESGTFQAVRSLLQGRVTPLAVAHGGVVVKGTGDGLLVRFGQVRDAVAWAQAVQADAGPIQLRIAINSGPVIFDEGDVFGDGVNIAARLLELAPPGGIALTEAVRDAANGSLHAVDLGKRTLKSMSRPVRVFAIAPEGVSLSPGGLSESAIPSIAVLPLENVSGDQADDYLADGLVEDIIVSLGGLGELMVMSHASTLAFGGRRVDPRDVGRVLGVRYVMMGSLRRRGGTLRVGFQLCDAESGRTLWSESAEAGPEEVFDLQDRIVGRIVMGVAPNVRAFELRRALRKQPGRFTAYDHTLRALHLIHDFEGNSFEAAGASLRTALADDPEFAMAHAWKAWWHMVRLGQGLADDPAREVAAADLSAKEAIELDTNNALALSIYGHLRSFVFHQYDLALLYLERARTTAPNSAVAWVFSSASMAYVGEGERAVAYAQRALRLSPLDRWLYFTHSGLCLAHYSAGSYAEAARWGRLAYADNPQFTANYRLLIGSLVALGEMDEARAMAARMMVLEPGFRVARWATTLQPFRDKAMGQVYADRLRAASLPD